MQVEGPGCKDLDLAEGMDSASKQEWSTEAQAAEQPPVAGQISRESESAAPKKPSAPRAPVHLSEAEISSRGFSSSPQPDVSPLDGSPHEQQGWELPSRAAPTAQPATPASPEGEPWQEVRAARRKPVSQQAVSKPSMRKASKHRRAVPHPALSQPCSREFQAAAQHTEQPSISPEDAVRPPYAQSMHVAAEQLPCLLPSSAGSALDHPDNRSFVQPPQIQASPLSKQPETFQATAEGSGEREAHTVLKRKARPDLSSATSSYVQVCVSTQTVYFSALS